MQKPDLKIQGGEFEYHAIEQARVELGMDYYEVTMVASASSSCRMM